MMRKLILCLFVIMIFANCAYSEMRAFCGFGHDLPTTLVGDSASISTRAKYQHAGNPSLRVAYDGINAAYFKLLDMSVAEIKGFENYGSTKLAVSGYLRVASFDSCEVLSYIDWVLEEASASIRITPDGHLSLYDDNGVLVDVGTTTLLLDTWYYIQFIASFSETSSYTLLINLVEELSGTADFGTDDFKEIRFGVSSTSVSNEATFFWANVSVDNDALPTTGQRVIVSNLDSQGSYTEWTRGVFSDLAEDPSDGDGTTAATITSGHRLTGDIDVYTDDMPDTTIVYGVMCRAISKSHSTGTMNLRCMIRSGTTDSQSATPQAVGSSWTQSAKINVTDPATGSAWVFSDVQNAEFGVRRATGGTDSSIVTSVWAEILVEANDFIIAQESGTTVLAFMSDLHAGGTAPYLDHTKMVLNWLQMHAAFPAALCVAGDLAENTEETEPFNEWIRNPLGGDLDDDIDIVVAPGNWDTDITPNDTEHFGTVPENPYSAFKALYTDFGSNEYMSKDFGKNIRIACLNNNSDYLDLSGHSKYFNCNPPGAEMELNPDNSGITNSLSAQRVWLDALFPSSAPRWRILMMHRSLWAPYDEDPRVLNRDARSAVKTPIDNGVSLIVSGDIHVGSFSGPWYPEGGPEADTTALYVEAGDAGAYSLTLSGGYLPRNVDTEVLPDHATTCHWASGGENTQKAQAALIIFKNNGNTARIIIFESYEGNYLGSVAYDGTIYRNRSGDGGVRPTLFNSINSNTILNGAILHSN